MLCSFGISTEASAPAVLSLLHVHDRGLKQILLCSLLSQLRLKLEVDLLGGVVCC